MRRLTDEKVRPPASTDERLRALADLAAGLCACLREPEPGRRRGAIHALASRYEGLGIKPASLDAVAQRAGAELLRDAPIFGIGPAGSDLIVAVAAACQGQRESDAALQGPVSEPRGRPIPAAANATAGSSLERTAILNAGIQDITNSLASDCELNDILRMILETRGISFTRVLWRDPAVIHCGALAGRTSTRSRGFHIRSSSATRFTLRSAMARTSSSRTHRGSAEIKSAVVPEVVPARSLAFCCREEQPVGCSRRQQPPGALRFDTARLQHGGLRSKVLAEESA
jgi:hypothetical protein